MKEPNWEEQHEILVKKLKGIGKESDFRIYYVNLPRPDIREIAEVVPHNLRASLKTYKSGEMRPTITVCIARVRKAMGFVAFRGVSVCYPLDNPNRLKGRCYAMRKALRAYRDKGDVGVDFTYIGASAFVDAGRHIRSEVRGLIRWRPPVKNVPGTWVVGSYGMPMTIYEKKQFAVSKKR